jgi:hypothetical protein
MILTRLAEILPDWSAFRSGKYAPEILFYPAATASAQACRNNLFYMH